MGCGLEETQSMARRRYGVWLGVDIECGLGEIWGVTWWRHGIWLNWCGLEKTESMAWGRYGVWLGGDIEYGLGGDIGYSLRDMPIKIPLSYHSYCICLYLFTTMLCIYNQQ